MATLSIETITTTSTLNDGFVVYYIDADLDSITVTIPFPAEEGVNFLIKRCDLSSNTVIVDTTDGTTIDGMPSINLLPGKYIQFIGYDSEWTTNNLVPTGTTGPTGPQGNPGSSGESAIYFSSGGNSIGRGGEFIGQGVVKRDPDEIQLLVASPVTATTIAAVKEGNDSGVATLYVNGVATDLQTSLSGSGVQKNQSTGSVRLNVLDQISVKMEPDSGDWMYGAATIIIE